MCSVGGPMADLKMKKLKTKRYHCLDCDNEFKGIGRRVVCPACQSDNVKELE
jgi:Zn finger protein HypA/HybF involved in hydrogenase expression